MNLPNNSILDVIISLVLIYALLSILVSILLEYYNHKNMSRGLHLRDAINRLLDDPLNKHYGELFYNHFLIRGIHSDENKLPPYISSGLFASVLLELLGKEADHHDKIRLVDLQHADGKQYEKVDVPDPKDVKARFDAAFANMNPSPLKDTLEHCWHKADGDVARFKQHIEVWFNEYMDQVSGWYKNNQRWSLRAAGLLVAIALNIDSLHLVKVLSMDETMRNKLVATAENVADNYEKKKETERYDASALLDVIRKSIPDTLQSTLTEKPKDLLGYLSTRKDSATYNKVKDYIRKDSLSRMYLLKADSLVGFAASLNIPIGWSSSTAPVSWFLNQRSCDNASIGLKAYYSRRNNCPDFWVVLKYIVGIAISTISLSFGAPFWFDLLVKFVNIRKAVKPAVETKS